MNLTGQAVYEKTPNQRFTAIESRYYAWLHQTECCLTGTNQGIEIAHTGPKAMAMKAPLNTCLPIFWRLHLIEEKQQDAFWEGVGIPDHLAWADRLFEIHQSGESPWPLLRDMQARANTDFIEHCLTMKGSYL